MVLQFFYVIITLLSAWKSQHDIQNKVPSDDSNRCTASVMTPAAMEPRSPQKLQGTPGSWESSESSSYRSTDLLIYRSICPSICLFVHLSTCPSVYAPIYLSIYPSIHPSTHPSIYLYLCLYLSMPIYTFLTTYLFTYVPIHRSTPLQM